MRSLHVSLSGALLAASLVWGSALHRAGAQETAAGTDERIVGHTFVPERREFRTDFVRQLRVPDGFEVNLFAQDLENPRIMAVGNDGVVYVTQPSQNNVVALRDNDKDGRADQRSVVVSDIPYVHGITVHENRLYLAPPTRLYVADIRPDGTVGKPQLLMDGLPDGGQHPNRTLHFGPDGMLYLSIGSSCNACPEPNPEHATMLQVRIKGDDVRRRIFARGLRNTVGFGWHPVTREFWGVDHGSDWRGADLPPEELNHIREGLHYGWPWAYGRRQVDKIIAQKPENMTKEEFAAQTEPSVLEYQAHAAPMQMVFYDRDQFPAEYRNDAFVTMRGSWNRKPAVGYEVVRIRFNDQGRPERFESFMTGFLAEDGKVFLARLCGLAVAPDGSLLVGDDTNGVIYRVAHRKPPGQVAARQSP